MIAEYWVAIRIFNRDTRLFLVAGAIHAMAIVGIYGVVLNLYLVRMGYGIEFIGLINAAGLLSFAIFSIPAGYVAQRWGIRRTMIASLGIGVVAMGLMPLADLLPEAIRGGWLATGNVLAALGTAAFHVTMMPYLMASTGPEERRQAFSVRWALFYVGSFAGSILGGVLPPATAFVTQTSLQDPQPYRYALFVGGALLVGALWAVSRAREMRATAAAIATTKGQKFPLGILAIFAVAVFLWATAEGAAQAFFNVYLDTRLDVTTFQIGIIIAIARIAGIPASLAAPDIARRIGNGQTAALASLGAAVSLIPLALVQHWAAAGAAFVAVNISVGILAPASYLFMFALVAERWRLTIASISIGAGVAGFAAIALGGGFMIARLDYPIFFLTSAAITAVGVLLFWLRFVRPPQSADLPVSAAGAAPD